MTTSDYIARWVGAKCTGDHRHVQLVGGRAQACGVYPRRLCEAMLRGLKDQLVADGHNNSNASLFMTGHDGEKDHELETYDDDLSNLPHAQI